MKIYSETNQIDLTKLDKFVYNHPHGNFFQSVNAFLFFQSVDNYEPILIVASEDEGIVGSLLAVVIKEGKGLKTLFSRRAIVWGGPLVKDDDPEILFKILEKFNEISKQNAIYSQFRNFYDMKKFLNAFIEQGWVFEEHLNIIVDLSKSEDDLWNEMDSKGRNKIRRAENEGTCFKVLENRIELDVTYDILKEIYNRTKLPFPQKNFFEKAYDILAPDNFNIFLALNRDKIIGTMYVLCFKDILYDWYAGSYEPFYKKYPNDLIPWKVFLWGRENGFKKFDFGGAGKPGIPYGVRDYKKKFGGEFVNYGRFVNIYKPFLYQIGKLGLKVWQQFK